MKILWLDLETTGLDARQDRILEVACKVADFTNPFEATYVFDGVIAAPKNELRMDKIVWEMHTKNGLLDACAKSTMTLDTCEEALLGLVPEIEDKEERWLLGGSTIHFDGSFLKEHMPRLYKRLSYRLYDVSAIKLFCRSLGMEKLPKEDAHRAMVDVECSIRHAKKCAEWLAWWTGGPVIATAGAGH